MPKSLSHLDGQLEFKFQDRHLFIVEKPPSLHSVGEGDSLEWRLKSKFAQLGGLKDAGLVQRLDFETTGVLVGGFTEQVATELKYALSVGRFAKSYLVLVEGACTRGSVVEGYLFSRYRGSAKVSMKTKEGKRSLFSRSVVLPIATVGSVSLVRVDCALARRHQVRVHMASIGFPLVGDALYGAKMKLPDIGVTDHGSDFVLVAESVSFPHPVTKEPVTAKATLTSEALLQRLQGSGASVRADR
jgi:23S rRNA pseudouridine1911/1915/1917 synthase